MNIVIGLDLAQLGTFWQRQNIKCIAKYDMLVDYLRLYCFTPRTRVENCIHC